MPSTKEVSPSPKTSDEILKGPFREFIMLAGKDGSGKTSAVVSLARWVEQVLSPDAVFYVIDTENKFPSAMKSFLPDVPKNLRYFKTHTMDQAIDALDEVMNLHKPGDWLAVESMARLWERAQDLGYQAVTGQAKAQYLEKRRQAQGQKLPVTPKPDDLWSITKGAHDGAFLDLISQSSTLNRILTTTLQRPPKPDSFIKESQARKDTRVEFGLDMGMDGAPRLPCYVETMGILDMRGGQFTCRMLRDNLSELAIPRVEFDVPGKKDWGPMFWTTCRNG